MAKTESISDERIEGWISQLIDAARWQGNARSMGYAAGDPAKAQDDKDVGDAKAGLLAAISALRAANSDGGMEPNIVGWANAFHDGPLMANDHDFDTESAQGKWCYEVAEFFWKLAHPPAKALDGIAVKALEWRGGDGISADKSYFTAETVCGTYWVIEGQWGLERQTANPENEWFVTDSEAFSAAQADFDQRIRSALSKS